MLYLLLYAIITVISYLLIHSSTNQFPQELLITVCTIYTIIFYNIINYKTITAIYGKLLNHKKSYFMLMFSLLIIWASTFIGIHFISPTFFMFVMMGIGAVYGAIFNYIDSKKRIDLIIFVFIALGILFFIACIIQHYALKEALLLTLFILIVGGFDYLYAKTSYAISVQLTLSASEILAVRFWLMLIIPMGIIISKNLFEGQHYLEYLRVSNFYWTTSLMTVFSFIIPIYCYQKSILVIGANDTLLYCAGLPCMMYVTEMMLKIKSGTTPTMGYLTLFLLIPIIMRIYTKTYSCKIKAIS